MSLIAAPEQMGYLATSFRITEALIGVPALAIAPHSRSCFGGLAPEIRRVFQRGAAEPGATC